MSIKNNFHLKFNVADEARRGSGYGGAHGACWCGRRCRLLFS